MTQKSQAALVLPEEPAALATIEAPPQGGLVALAIQQNAPVEVLERLVALQERHEADEARKAFHAAMSAFKANPPRIHKDHLVDFTSSKGRTTYRHATLANVVEKISAALSEHGLSATWKTDQDGQGCVSVTCTITHRLGHSESTSLKAPYDETGNKNSIQAVGSAVTYLQRYTLLALTGLATHEQDDDGRMSSSPLINEFEAAELLRTVQELRVDEERFCDHLKVEVLSDLTEAQLPKAKALLAQKRRVLEKKGELA